MPRFVSRGFLFVCAVLLVCTGIAKLYNSHEFLIGIIRVGLLPEPVRYVASEWIPWFELVVGAGLMTSTFRHGAALLTGAFGVGIVLYSALALLLGRSTDCGCLGALASPGSWWPHMAVGVFFCLVVIVERAQQAETIAA